MRMLRALMGSLLWILSGVLGLVGALLCVTVLLLPLGIPVLALARRLFKYSMVFFVPRKVRHPVQEAGKSARRSARDAAGAVPELPSRRSRRKAGKKVRKKGKKGKKAVARTGKKVGKAAKRTREKVAG